MSLTKIVVLAAGKGNRMGADEQKTLIKVDGKPMLGHLLDAIEKSEINGKPIIVYGYEGEEVCEYVGERGICTQQIRQLGTGDALRAAKYELEGADRVVVFYGDHPLVSAETIKKIVDYHEQKPSPILLAVAQVESYEGWQKVFEHFGRIIRDKKEWITAIREYKDATEEEHQIKEINPGYYVFEGKWLWDHIDLISNKNVQEEYYLTDLIQMAVDEDQPVRTYQIPIEECIGVNTPEEREIAEELMKKRKEKRE